MIQPQPYPLVYRTAVTAEFIDYVNNLIETNIEQFRANQAGESRKFMKMDYVAPDGDAYLYSIKKKLAEHYNIGDYIIPPTLKDFVGYITEGGYIHPHTDPDLPGTRHVRINVLVKQPQGCIPLLEDVPIDVAVGDAWLNLASLCVHSTTPVTGPGYRSAISFGYQISPERCDEFHKVHKAWMREVQQKQSPALIAPRPSPAGPLALPHDDVIAIERAAETLVSALNRSDMSALPDVLGRACVVMPPARRAARGAGVVEFWRAMASETEAVQIHSGAFDALGEGVVRDIGTLSFRRRQQPADRVTHRYLAIWVKADESWRLETMTWNRDAPVGAAAPRGGAVGAARRPVDQG